MNKSTFKNMCDSRVRECLGLMFNNKSFEYWVGGDPLYNFKRAGEIAREAPEKALLGMWMKHFISVLDMVEKSNATGEGPLLAVMEEKFNDMHNYLFLLEAIFKEKRQVKK